MVSKPGRVIVGMDPHATSMAAAALGARLAGGMDATLELFVPVYNSQVSLAHFENREHLQHARDSLVRRHLEHLEERLASASIGGRVECHAAWDHPHEEALIRRVLERGAELLLVELPDGVAQGGRPLSAAQWQLVRHCPAPVLLTRGGAWREAPVVVAAVDPGGRHGRTDELDTRILKFAERIALCAGGTVHAFHAWERTLRTLVGGREEMLAPGRPDTGIEQRHREAVYSVLAAAEVAPARVSLVEGRPEQALPSYCHGVAADVVVMGAIARNPFGRIFIGSTAERVLEQLPCDLLVVKPGAFRTPVSSERWPAEQAATPILGVPGI
jgi:universal stress protein E